MAGLKRTTTTPLAVNPHPLVGRRILAVHGKGTQVALVLDDASILLASRDEEGNGPGVLMWRQFRADTQIVVAHRE